MKENEFNSLLGHRIRTLRKAKNLSQEAFAEIIDKSVDTVSNIERGIFAPRLETALEIADALDIQIWELFQIRDLPLENKQKTKILDDILDLLQEQPDEILHFTLAQTKQLIALKEDFIEKIRK